MSKKHFIFDFETLSTDVFNGVMIDCAVLIFDWERFISDKPYSFKELEGLAKKYKLSVKDQRETHGYKVMKSTVEWWKEQSKEAQKLLVPSKDDLTCEEFCVNILKYLKKYGPIEYWWSRSNIFDPIMLARIMRDTGHFETGMDKELRHWKVRDTRTWIDAKLDFPSENGFMPISDESYWNKTFVHHDSIHDVVADVLRLQTIARLENDLEGTIK